jgi:hypothetical protein
MRVTSLPLLVLLAVSAPWLLHCNGSIEVLSTEPSPSDASPSEPMDAGPSGPVVTLPEPAPFPGTQEGACKLFRSIDFNVAGCGNACIVAARPGSPVKMLLGWEDVPYSFGFIAGATGSHVLVQTYESASRPKPPRLLSVPLAGGAYAEADTFAPGVNAYVSSTANLPSGFSYTAVEQETFASDSVVSLRQLAPGTAGPARVLATGLPGPAAYAALFEASGYVYVAHSKAILRVPVGGGSAETILTFPAEIDGSLPPVATDGTSIFTVALDDQKLVHLWKLPLGGGPPVDIYEVAWSSAETPTALAVDAARGKLFALTRQKLLEMDFSGGAVRVFPIGAPFPQHGGTLLPGHLVVDNSKVYFEEVCLEDFDAPEYGPRVFDPVANTVAWRDSEPGFPIVPHLAERDRGVRVVGGAAIAISIGH